MITGKTISLTRWTFVGKVMSLLFNMLSRLVIAFLRRNKRLLISWLQLPSAVILELKKIKSVMVSIVSPSICQEVMGLDAMILVFWMLSTCCVAVPYFWDSWEITAYFILIPFQNTRAEYRDLCRQEVVKFCHGEQYYKVLLKSAGRLWAQETSTDSCGQENFQDPSLPPAARPLGSPQMGLAAYGQTVLEFR